MPLGGGDQIALMCPILVPVYLRNKPCIIIAKIWSSHYLIRVRINFFKQFKLPWFFLLFIQPAWYFCAARHFLPYNPYSSPKKEWKKDEILKLRIVITMSEDRIHEGYSYPHKAKNLSNRSWSHVYSLVVIICVGSTQMMILNSRSTGQKRAKKDDKLKKGWHFY